VRARKATKATPASAERDLRDSDLCRIESIATESRPEGQAAFIALSSECAIQQAKNSGGEPQFLQIEAKDGSATPNKSKPKAEPKLTRVAFKVSRLMEFCTRRELQNQTGHSAYDWALVVLKELMDNALDACEEVEVAPEISIDVKDGSITIRDNAGGIDPATIESILDYTIRVSSREAYCSPTRGAQGNALKSILAMAFVPDAISSGAISTRLILGCASKISTASDRNPLRRQRPEKTFCASNWPRTARQMLKLPSC
jgi:hypothetical protein